MHGGAKNLEPITHKKKKSNAKTISTNWFLILNVLVKDKKKKLLLPIQKMESNRHLKKAGTKYH